MNELCLKDWYQFLQVADHLDVGPTGMQTYGFRGQSLASWGLQPSLLRHLNRLGLNEQQALQLEARAVAEFQAQAHHHIQPNTLATTTDTVSWWTLMQHHGAPTRLLDWTGSIYVAAYFAAIAHPEDDGAIWIVHTFSVREKMTQDFPEHDLPASEDIIKARFLQPNAPRALIFAGRRNLSDRMIAQQGFFSACCNVLGDHGEIIGRAIGTPSERELFRKLILPGKLKRLFLRRLRAMNIMASSLFPGLDGLGRSVSELIQLAT